MLGGLVLVVGAPVERLTLPAASGPHAGTSVAYHSACSLQHGQQISRMPASLLTAAGFDVRPVAEGHLCCGSAGTYNLLQPEIAERLRERKVRNLERTGAAVVAAGSAAVEVAAAVEAVVATVVVAGVATGSAGSDAS